MRFTSKVSSQEAKVTNSVFTIQKSGATKEATNSQCEIGHANSGASFGKSTTLNVNHEQIEDFATVRGKIFPVVKARSWIESTKDLLLKIDPKGKLDVLYIPLKSVPGSGIGYTFAIINDDSASLSYILSSHLDAWRTSVRAVEEVALRNLEQKLAAMGENLWMQSKTGVYYIASLGSLSASVVLLPQFIGRLNVEDGDAVAVAPSSDLCMVVGSKMETQLCIVGELSLRYSSDPHHLKACLRINKQRMVLSNYSPRSFAGEFSIPSTPDEVAGLKLRVKPVAKKK